MGNTAFLSYYCYWIFRKYYTLQTYRWKDNDVKDSELKAA